MKNYVVASLITYLLGAITPINCGPLDTALSWARADRLPIEVNLPWLPCKFFFYILKLIDKPTNNGLVLVVVIVLVERKEFFAKICNFFFHNC